MFKYLWRFPITIIKDKYRLLVTSSVGVMPIMSVTMVASKSLNAQTIGTTKVSTTPKNEIPVDGVPQWIAINTLTNKDHFFCGGGTLASHQSNLVEPRRAPVPGTSVFSLTLLPK